MAPKTGKRPKASQRPAKSVTARVGSQSPTPSGGETVAWAFGIADLDGDWGWRTKASADWWKEILPKLQQFENMTWVEIESASGGKSEGRGNNSHFVDVSKLPQRTKRRLREIQMEDVDQLFSLRLDAGRRIYGIRDGRVLKVLWYDPHHKDRNRAVCPTKKR